MAPLAELASCWPPALAKSASMVLCLRVEANVDDVFHTTWVDETLSVAHHKSRGDTALRETPWVATKAELETCSWHEPGDPAKDKASIATHRYRKVRFESAPSALASKPFENTEVIQCNVYSPGKQYVLEAITTTTAPYGDKFTIYLRTILTAESRSRCTLYITHAVDWDPSMNFMIKPMVAKGMDVGLRGAFKSHRQMLAEKHPCTDITEQDWEQSRQAAQATNFMHTNVEELVEDEVAGGEMDAAVVAAATANVAKAAQHAEVAAPTASPHPPNLLSFMSEQLVYRDQVALLSDVVGAGMRSISDQGLVARVLSVILTLSLVSACITVFNGIQKLCLAGGPLLAPVCYPLTHIIDVPDTTVEVLSTLALVALINYGIMKASELSVAYLNKTSGSAPPQPAQHHGPAANTGAPSPARQLPTASKPSPPATPAANAAAAAGAVAGVAVAVATAKGAAQGAGANGAAPASVSAVAPAGAHAAKAEAAQGGAPAKSTKPPPAPVIVKSNSTSPLRGAKVPSARRPSTSESVTSPSSSAQPQVLEMQCLSPTEERGSQGNAAGAAGKAAESGAGQKLQRKSTTGVSAAGKPTDVQKGTANANGAAAGTTSGRAVGTSEDGQSASPGHGKGVETERSWLDSFTDNFKGWSKSQETFTNLYGSGAEAAEYGLMAPAGAVSASQTDAGQTPAVLQKSRSDTDMAAAANGTPAAKGTTVPGSPPGRADLASASMPVMVMDSQDLEDEDPDVVEEEVFENERFQPFRLWGHSWPGHFLPSDRVGHWSDRKETPFGPAAMVFEQVAPKLPNDGWRWVEDKWSIDMEGVDVDAVDADGWYYALDFNYLRKHGAGFQVAGSGKCSPHHFVRRRRWVRIRARIGMDASSPVPITQTFSKDAAPDDFERGGAAQQRQLRTSSDETNRRNAHSGGGGSSGHAREPSFSVTGAVSMPSSPTTSDLLAGSTATPKLAASWSALDAPTASIMDRLQGSTSPQPASAPPPLANSEQEARVTVGGKVSAALGMLSTDQPAAVKSQATAGNALHAAPGLTAIEAVPGSSVDISSQNIRRGAAEDSSLDDKGNSNQDALTVAMMAAAAAVTASKPSSTSPTAAVPSAAGSASQSIWGSPPSQQPQAQAPPSIPTASASQHTQAARAVPTTNPGDTPANIALNALSLLENLQSSGSLAFASDLPDGADPSSLGGWSGQDAADFSFSNLSLETARTGKLPAGAVSDHPSDNAGRTGVQARNLTGPDDLYSDLVVPEPVHKEDVLHDPLGAQNQ